MFQNILFQTPTILFGVDSIQQIGEQARKLGTGKALLISGPQVQKAGILDKVKSSLDAAKIEVEVNIQDRDTPEPAVEVVEATAKIAKKGKFDVNHRPGRRGASWMSPRWPRPWSPTPDDPGLFGREEGPPAGHPDDHRPDHGGTGPR
jgi:hypothetical protein